jgi:hypothetical protein
MELAGGFQGPSQGWCGEVYGGVLEGSLGIAGSRWCGFQGSGGGWGGSLALARGGTCGGSLALARGGTCGGYRGLGLGARGSCKWGLLPCATGARGLRWCAVSCGAWRWRRGAGAGGVLRRARSSGFRYEHVQVVAKQGWRILFFRKVFAGYIVQFFVVVTVEPH